MSVQSPGGNVGRGMMLESWKQIAAYLHRNIRTCQMWEKDLGLPVHRLDSSARARVFAYADEIDRWRHDRLDERETGPGQPRELPTLPRWNMALIAGLTVFLIGAIGTSAWLLDHQAKVRWANDVAIPEIQRLMTVTEFEKTADLAFRARRYIPRSPALARLISQVTAVLSVETDPADADVWIENYFEPAGRWRRIGRTPIRSYRLSQGYKHWKIAKPGFETAEGTLSVYSAYDRKLEVKLARNGEVPPGMVKVTGGDFSPFISGLPGLKAVTLGDYALDRTEVTNRQYKEFLDAGGYQRSELWQEPFLRDGRAVAWADGIGEFVDKTGHPGPATWALGAYPPGQGDFPVSGVSWYEASAYAAYAGKKLPTVYHWNRALFSDIVSAFTGPYCNLQGGAPAPVASFKSLGPFGTYDMAGNVKEWCSNAMGDGRLILGGAWNEAQYMAISSDHYPPFFRAENFGFRCYRPEGGQADPPEAGAPMEEVSPFDFRRLRPCPDDVFAVIKDLYGYSKTDLAPEIESRQDWSDDTRVEKATYADASGRQRVMAYLFIPRRGRPPFQTIVFCPGGNAWRSRSVLEYGSVHSGDVELFNRSGRAFVIPVLPGTFDRWDGRSDPDSTFLDSSQHLKDFLIGVYRDFARCLDYLETRPEFDTGKLAFHSLSWGAWMGPLVVALENRFKAAVFLSGGLAGWAYKPVRYAAQTDMVNFAARVKVPVLVQNGRYDCEYPAETNVRPLFDLLGTPEKDKHLLLYETGHSIWLANECRKDMLEFLDRYLGPVEGSPDRARPER